LAHDVSASTDSGGVYLSARRVVEGPRKVAALFVGLGRRAPADELVALPRLLLGAAWIECRWPSPPSPRLAPRWFLGLELDAAKIAAVYVVSAPQKLARL
jgi:RNA polymerase sigma-70 factor (ECF subfamily)